MPGRPTVVATLLAACALLSAGFVPVAHGHDDGHAGGDVHHCVACCLEHHSPATATTTTTAATSAPDPADPAPAASRRPSGDDAALGTRTTRGPPV